MMFERVRLMDAVGGIGCGHKAEDKGDNDVGDLAKVGRTVGPTHLEGSGKDNMDRVGGGSDGEDVQEIRFQTALHDHTPEPFGKVKFRPVDCPFGRGVQHILE